MDIIAAISTGTAATAIGIVRVSGEGCFALIKMGVFAPPAASVFPVLPSLIAFVIVCLATQNKDHNHAIA